MNDPSLVRRLKSLADLDPISQNLIWQQRSFCKPLRQRRAFQVFQNKKVDPFLMADVIQCADVGMVQRRDYPRLAVEALLRIGVEGKMRRQNLECDGTTEFRIPRLIHLTHATRGKSRLDLVRPQLCTRDQRHGRTDYSSLSVYSEAE